MIDLIKILAFCLLGYISGSVLYGPIWARLLHTGSITENSKDHNPGVANAFEYGGLVCGILTLICELLKGYVPVKLFIITSGMGCLSLPMVALVIAAPVIGHVFPLFNGFKGGKGIAATFGCLLGLLPLFTPVGIMAASFIFFSIGLRISPHFYRTAISYIAALPIIAAYSIFMNVYAVGLSFVVISAAVGYRLFKSPEEKEKFKVGLLWMR